MLEHQNEFHKAEDFFKNLPENYSILEEEVDIETQMAYFKELKELKQRQFEEEEVVMMIGNLNLETLPYEEKKRTLMLLAGVEDVKAYRAIENFYKQVESGDLKSWAAMALQESRMLIESNLLDEKQVFISSGMGGKGDKLRYFVAGFLENGEDISEIQQQILKKEFSYALQNNNSELEKVEFAKQFILMTVLIPLKQELQGLFKPALDECINMGIEINRSLLLTNVKALEVSEIEQIINNPDNGLDALDALDELTQPEDGDE